MASQKEFKYTFKLKSGTHIDRGAGVVLEPGGIYHTDEDMLRKDGRNRWELVQEGKESPDDLKARIRELESRLAIHPSAPQAPSTDELESKSIKELRTVAAEMVPPVDLTTCTGKTEIINAIRQALDAA